MALTRDFKETVRARVQRDGRYREELFTGAINACLTGDSASGKAMLREGSEYPFSSAFIRVHLRLNCLDFVELSA